MATELLVTPERRLIVGGIGVPCAVGKNGIAAPGAKREGDGMTPAGTFPLREVFYRADRVPPPPDLGLPVRPLEPADGWCDAPDDPNYNRLVKHPHPASAEKMWREDELYDVVVVLGYNDDPVVPGMGSAIFFHCAKPDYPPTAGCVAVAHSDMVRILEMVETPAFMRIDA